MILRNRKKMLLFVLIFAALVAIILNVFLFDGPFYKDIIFYIAIALLLWEFQNMFNKNVEKDDPFLILLRKQYELHDKVLALVPATHIDGWNRYNGGLILGSHEIYFEAHPESAFNYKIKIPVFDIESAEYTRFLGIINGIRINMKNGIKHKVTLYDADKFLSLLQQEISLEQGVA